MKTNFKDFRKIGFNVALGVTVGTYIGTLVNGFISGVLESLVGKKPVQVEEKEEVQKEEPSDN